MAAAALSRSRGVAGVRTTRGLFFIFTLLCLVCLASSLMSKDKLEKAKEKVQILEKKLHRVKAEREVTSELMSAYVKLMDPLIALMKINSEDLPDDFPPLEGLLVNVKDFVVKAKTFIDGNDEEVNEDIENTEQKLRQLKKLIKYVEEQQAEF